MHNSILFALLLFCSLSLAAQVSLFNTLHATSDPVTVLLETDFKQLEKDKREKQYQPATVTFLAGERRWTFPGKMRPRGHVRLEVCQYPSLKIKLKKAALRAAGFSDVNEFKIVQPCGGGPRGAGYLRREALMYRLHQHFSPHAHRTIPLHLRERPTDSIPHGKTADRRAFIVEEEEQIEARYQSTIHRGRRASTRSLDRRAYANMCLFNYLILNVDWSVFNLHNVEIVGQPGSDRFIPIPYDFDYAGLVGTHYAVPQEGLGIESVNEAKWLGRGVTEDELREAATWYLKRMDGARALVDIHPDLTKYHRRRILKRLDEFERLLSNERKLMQLLR